jgi:hypothetical protein
VLSGENGAGVIGVGGGGASAAGGVTEPAPPRGASTDWALTGAAAAARSDAAIMATAMGDTRIDWFQIRGRRALFTPIASPDQRLYRRERGARMSNSRRSLDGDEVWMVMKSGRCRTRHPKTGPRGVPVRQSIAMIMRQGGSSTDRLGTRGSSRVRNR